jgi:Cu(I)/Ag(I) efflux system membrane fusion protein
MELIPVSTGGGENNPRQITMSENARKLAQIEVAPVERKFVEQEIRMVGKIEVDETRLSHITAWVPGRIDRLYVNYTGISVQEGNHLVELYSPELISTQQELLESIKAVKAINSSAFPEMKETTQRQLESVRERLRLWGLNESQIKKMEKNGKPTENITLYSPVSGIRIYPGFIMARKLNLLPKLYPVMFLKVEFLS